MSDGLTDCASCGEDTSFHMEELRHGPHEGMLVAICDECGETWEYES